ncbi:MAG: TorF family putative porin [Pseudohongiellaceae bacterium]
MKKLTRAILATGLITAAATVPAYADVSGNVSLASDYIFRGVSQTGGDMALQGGFDFEADNGFYAGVWGSNVTFADSLEVDFYAGFGGELGNNVGYDIGVIAYEYPSVDDLDFTEIYGSLSYVNFTAGLAYADDLGGYESLYTSLAYDMELANEFGLSIFGGITTYDEDFWGTEDSYTDYGVALSKSWSGIDFSLTLTDTDLDDNDCGGSDCDATVTFSMSKSL